ISVGAWNVSVCDLFWSFACSFPVRNEVTGAVVSTSTVGVWKRICWVNVSPLRKLSRRQVTMTGSVGPAGAAGQTAGSADRKTEPAGRVTVMLTFVMVAWSAFVHIAV